MLTWTQPHTIPSPPTKTKDNKRTRQEQKQQTPPPSKPEKQLQEQQLPLDQLITQQWSPPHTVNNSPPHAYHSPPSHSGSISQGTLPPADQQKLPFASSENGNENVPHTQDTFGDLINGQGDKDIFADLPSMAPLGQQLLSPPLCEVYPVPDFHFPTSMMDTTDGSAEQMFPVLSADEINTLNWRDQVQGHGPDQCHDQAQEQSQNQELEQEQDEANSDESNELRGYNVLHLAAHYGQTSIIRLLLKSQTTDVNMSTDRGQSALHLAASGCNAEAAGLLLQQGADLTLRDSLGQSSLHSAVRAGAVEVVRLLVERHRECIHLRDMTGCTPLHAAVIMGNEEIVQLLLEKGADSASVVT